MRKINKGSSNYNEINFFLNFDWLYTRCLVSFQPNEGYTKYAGIQYSPTDLAEYVFSTGDEEGVAVAVEELVREGMVSSHIVQKKVNTPKAIDHIITTQCDLNFKTISLI